MTVDLEGIDARVRAATAGPWEAKSPTRYGEVVAPMHPEPTAGYGGFLVAESCREPNATFIAHARDDIPALCAELRRVTLERDRLRALVDELLDVKRLQFVVPDEAP